MAICQTCTCETVEPGRVVIHDLRKWAVSAIPCPECMRQADVVFRDFGENVAKQREAAVWQDLAAMLEGGPDHGILGDDDNGTTDNCETGPPAN